MRIKPRAEQESVVDETLDVLENHDSVLVVAPTGYGKTVLMGRLAQKLIEAKKRVLTIVNLQVLLGQTVATMEHGFDIRTSALHERMKTYNHKNEAKPLVCDYSRDLLVTMPKTFTNTIDPQYTNRLTFDESFVPDYLILDEAHKATAAEFQKIRNMFPGIKVIGFTATPYRDKNEEGESLEEWYGDRMIVAATMSELIGRGDLATPRYFKATDPHYGKMWLKATRGHNNRRTIIFTDDTNHSKLIEKQFLGLGIKCEVVTSGKGKIGDIDYVPSQSPEVRDAMFRRFNEGTTEVLISVNALCEGFDEKKAKFCFLTRRVANIAFYQQMVGRVLRKYKDKPFGYIYDFADNICPDKGHGRVEAIEWPRAAKGKVLERDEQEMTEKSFNRRANVWKICEAPDCGHVFNIKKNRTCNRCGQSHVLLVRNTISESIKEWFGLTHKQFEEMAPKVKMALGNPMYHSMVNKQLGTIVFDSSGIVEGPGTAMMTAIEAYEKTKRRVGNKYVGDWDGVFLTELR